MRRDRVLAAGAGTLAPMSAAATALGAIALIIWLYLTVLRDGFWRADQRLPAADGRGVGPGVVAVVPARDEADVVAASVKSLLRQDYVPALRIVLVDDASGDGTAEAARAAAASIGASDRLRIVDGAARPPGWTGKMWAVAQGVEAAVPFDPRYLLLTDADVAHEAGNVRALVAKAECDRLDLVSLMVLLHCRAPIERLLIPAFVFFFQKLYPFPAVNQPKRRTAAAAGGCMLVRVDALARSGGIAAIRGELIDDCGLARRIKAGGPIWLGLTEKAVSLRPYGSLGPIWRMVARSAYTQLRHSPWLLGGAVIGMALTYLAPPLAFAVGIARESWPAVACGGGAWALMILAYAPALRLYGLSPAWGLALPFTGVLYACMTVDSAWRHWRGRDGAWKGRLRGGIVLGEADRRP